MNGKSFRPLLGALLLLLTLVSTSACLAPLGAGIGIEVGGGPPRLRAEVIGAAPGPGYVWVNGYWDWGNDGYYWVPGNYVRAPHSHARWEAPRYAHRHGRWYYQRGHWR